MQAKSSETAQHDFDAAEAGRYFRHMAEFVGFGEEEVQAVRESRFIIEKHIPDIVAGFYTHLLHYPPTRKFFLKADGSIDQEYLQLRMHHLTNFWRRTASAELGDDYAYYVDYVGRTHTSRGADPKIYIPERYVIGQVGFVQHAIQQALRDELEEIDPELEARATRAWNLLMMVILEMLARAYSDEREADGGAAEVSVDFAKIRQLAAETYERNLDLYRSMACNEVPAGRAADIAEGERKIIEVDGLSIGVFHHKGAWYGVRNHCLHRGGPVCTGSLVGDTLTCPWHGYQYDVTTGALLRDPSAALEMYEVVERNGELTVRIPIKTWDGEPVSLAEVEEEPAEEILPENAFRLGDLQPGRVGLVQVEGEPVAVYNVDGVFYATQDGCTHEGGPLSDGTLEESCITCPWHGSRFDVRDGRVLRGPAGQALRTYRVIVEGEIGRVE